MLTKPVMGYLAMLYAQSRSVMLPRLCLTATAGTYLVRGSNCKSHDALKQRASYAITQKNVSRIELAKTLVRAATH